MKDGILMGMGRHIVPVPAAVWKSRLSKSAEHGRARVEFMTEAHHRVRDFVVLELPRAGKPLSRPYIAQSVGLPLEQVQVILEELEKNMTFLYRSDGEAVDWAYPVTVDETPHQVTFSTGERINAA
ncbi:hypothetical protein ACFLWA_13230 [Chloroflexota bacterium]